MGTSVNLELLLRELRGSRRRDRRCCVFIDFKSAYNTVRRDVLYDALVDRGILSRVEVAFLRALHASLYFVDGQGERVYLRDGVHQGSPLSPALYNVYMEVVLGVLLLLVPRGVVWYKVYADDLVLVTSHAYLRRVLQQLRRTATDYGLVLNESKSGVFAVKRHRALGSAREVEGFPVVGEYRYLGVLIDDRGSIEPHLRRLR
jgi:hypothetical protein